MLSRWANFDTRLPAPPRDVTRDFVIMGVLLAGVLIGTGMATALEVGEQAPDFTLPSTQGGEISLSQCRKKKLGLLEFYGADFSPV